MTLKNFWWAVKTKSSPKEIRNKASIGNGVLNIKIYQQYLPTWALITIMSKITHFFKTEKLMYYEKEKCQSCLMN